MWNEAVAGELKVRSTASEFICRSQEDQERSLKHGPGSDLNPVPAEEQT